MDPIGIGIGIIIFAGIIIFGGMCWWCCHRLAARMDDNQRAE
jgi:hypothetical protein